MAGKSESKGTVEYKKLYYPISEVAKLTGVKAHVLRYWESEFPTLKPRKTRTGSRRYRPADIDRIFEIKELLYEQGFKIAGARKMLRQKKTPSKEPTTAAAPQMALKFAGMDDTQRLAFLKDELRQVLEMIRELEPAADGAAAGEPIAGKREMKGKG